MGRLLVADTSRYNVKLQLYLCKGSSRRDGRHHAFVELKHRGPIEHAMSSVWQRLGIPRLRPQRPTSRLTDGSRRVGEVVDRSTMFCADLSVVSWPMVGLAVVEDMGQFAEYERVRVVVVVNALEYGVFSPHPVASAARHGIVDDRRTGARLSLTLPSFTRATVSDNLSETAEF